MTDSRQIINRFFVEVFNDILILEERSIGERDLSISELHVLDAVCRLYSEGESIMKNIAAQLRLSAGAATVAVNTLVRKGYLYRENGREDRRKVYIFPTQKALTANEKHKDFHELMINCIEENVNEEEMEVLCKALQGLNSFFTAEGNV